MIRICRQNFFSKKNELHIVRRLHSFEVVSRFSASYSESEVVGPSEKINIIFLVIFHCCYECHTNDSCSLQLSFNLYYCRDLTANEMTIINCFSLSYSTASKIWKIPRKFNCYSITHSHEIASKINSLQEF